MYPSPLVKKGASRKGRGNPRNLLPNPLYIPHLCLNTKFTLRSDLTSYFLNFDSKDGELVDHVVDGIDEVEHFTCTPHPINPIAQTGERRKQKDTYH
jgi:hypothetical protein